VIPRRELKSRCEPAQDLGHWVRWDASIPTKPAWTRGQGFRHPRTASGRRSRPSRFLRVPPPFQPFAVAALEKKRVERLLTTAPARSRERSLYPSAESGRTLAHPLEMQKFCRETSRNRSDPSVRSHPPEDFLPMSRCKSPEGCFASVAGRFVNDEPTRFGPGIRQMTRTDAA